MKKPERYTIEVAANGYLLTVYYSKIEGVSDRYVFSTEGNLIKHLTGLLHKDVHPT